VTREHTYSRKNANHKVFETWAHETGEHMNLVTIIGARPQFIKAAPVSAAFAETGTIEESIIHTGQHYDHGMSQVFFDQLGIPTPKLNLAIAGGNHGAMTGRMLIAIEEALIRMKPDKVLVYGDTNSTLAGALAAAKLNIPISHVEAGLRAFDHSIPEEINRVMTDHLSNQLFAPTKESVQNLLREGLPNASATVHWVGDVMLDAALQFRSRAVSPSGVVLPEDFVLLTVHRAENTDDPQALTRIVTAVNTIHTTLLPVVMPLHPRTKKAVEAAGLTLKVITIEPTGYLETLWLLNNAKLIITDSGGMQKEAYYFGKHSVTLRSVTEWPELVATGVNTLVGNDSPQVIDATKVGLASNVFKPNLEPYGNGNASNRIAQHIRLP
jgi:UDP-GlcNAc3NAcA epimerase